MRCPFCNTMETKVIDSRLVGEGDEIRRRRECPSCFERFTTYENAALILPRVIKRDGQRCQFDLEKLRNGMLRALEKRPVPMEDVEESIQRVLRNLRAGGEREVSSQTIGSWVMDELRKLDQVAYVRFASVYRCFQDVNAFREEIQRLEESD